MTDETTALPMVPYGIQLQEVVVRQIRAERTATPALRSELRTNISVSGLSVGDGKGLVSLDVQTGEAHDEIFVSLVADFRYTDAFTDAQAEELLRTGMLAVLLPYAREIVHHLSMRMGIVPIILSMVAVQKEQTHEHE